MSDIAMYSTTGSVIAYLIVKEVVTYMKSKGNGNGSSNGTKLKETIETNNILTQLCKSNEMLIEVHKGADNKKIADQISDIWYDRKAYHKTMEKLYTAVDNLNLSVNKLIEKTNGKTDNRP